VLILVRRPFGSLLTGISLLWIVVCRAAVRSCSRQGTYPAALPFLASAAEPFLASAADGSAS